MVKLTAPRPGIPMTRALVAGVDTSTQACKVVVRDAETGALVRSGRAPHPPGTEVAPRAWEEAFVAAAAAASPSATSSCSTFCSRDCHSASSCATGTSSSC